MSARMALSPKGYETDSTIGEYRIESEIESSKRHMVTPPKDSPNEKAPISLLNQAHHQP